MELIELLWESEINAHMLVGLVIDMAKERIVVLQVAKMQRTPDIIQLRYQIDRVEPRS